MYEGLVIRNGPWKRTLKEDIEYAIAINDKAKVRRLTILALRLGRGFQAMREHQKRFTNPPLPYQPGVVPVNPTLEQPVKLNDRGDPILDQPTFGQPGPGGGKTNQLTPELIAYLQTIVEPGTWNQVIPYLSTFAQGIPVDPTGNRILDLSLKKVFNAITTGDPSVWTPRTVIGSDVKQIVGTSGDNTSGTIRKGHTDPITGIFYPDTPFKPKPDISTVSADRQAAAAQAAAEVAAQDAIKQQQAVKYPGTLVKRKK